jgi:hypothetical protein
MMRIQTFLLVLLVGIIAGLKIQVNTKAGEIHGFVQKTKGYFSNCSIIKRNSRVYLDLINALLKKPS